MEKKMKHINKYIYIYIIIIIIIIIKEQHFCHILQQKINKTSALTTPTYHPQGSIEGKTSILCAKKVGCCLLMACAEEVHSSPKRRKES
jgi:hypothetical protein